MPRFNGSILKRLREIAGLEKPGDLAKISGVDQSVIWDLEEGQTKDPRLSTLKKLAQALNVSVSTLIGETPDIPKIHSDPERWIRELENRCQLIKDPTERKYVELAIETLFKSHAEIIRKVSRKRHHPPEHQKKAEGA